MYKFVKTKTFNAWCLLYNGEALSIDFNARRHRKAAYDLINGKMNEHAYRYISTHPDIDYFDLFEKCGTILIHENGTWHTDLEENFTEFAQGVDFPFDTEYDTVVCENDATAPQDFIDILTSKGMKVRVINYFGTRSEESIKEIFSKAKTITFTTTFMDFTWFETMLECCNKNHVILGRCYDDRKVEHAIKMAKDKKLNITFISAN